MHWMTRKLRWLVFCQTLSFSFIHSFIWSHLMRSSSSSLLLCQTLHLHSYVLINIHYLILFTLLAHVFLGIMHTKTMVVTTWGLLFSLIISFSLSLSLYIYIYVILKFKYYWLFTWVRSFILFKLNNIQMWSMDSTNFVCFMFNLCHFKLHNNAWFLYNNNV